PLKSKLPVSFVPPPDMTTLVMSTFGCPARSSLAVAFASKFVPCRSVMDTLPPVAPLFGVIDEIVGPPVTAKHEHGDATPPSPFVTLTSCAPVVALDETVTGTTNDVAVTAVAVPAVTPVPVNVTTGVPLKPV